MTKMTKIENQNASTNCELSNSELDRVRGGGDGELLKYAIAYGVHKGVAESQGMQYPTGPC
jgi:hypothetical protein